MHLLCKPLIPSHHTVSPDIFIHEHTCALCTFLCGVLRVGLSKALMYNTREDREETESDDCCMSVGFCGYSLPVLYILHAHGVYTQHSTCMSDGEDGKPVFSYFKIILVKSQAVRVLECFL